MMTNEQIAAMSDADLMIALANRPCDPVIYRYAVANRNHLFRRIETVFNMIEASPSEPKTADEVLLALEGIR